MDPSCPSARFGFGLSAPRREGTLRGESLRINIKEFCDKIKSEEEICLSVLSTYSIDMSHVLSQCASLLHADVLILHGSQVRPEEGDAAWCTYTSDPARRNTVHSCFVGPSTQRYRRGRAAEGPTAAAYDVVSSRGVHHSKYVLVFTRQRLHVFITTANLVADQSVNGAWVQSFDRRENPESTGCEFGAVLGNFVRQQCRHASAPAGCADLWQWVLDSALADSISTDFDFQTAKVDLVSVVPGRYELRRVGGGETETEFLRISGLSQPHYNIDEMIDAVYYCRQCEASREIGTTSCMMNLRFCYGALRMREVLQRRSSDLFRSLTHHDYFVAQPTSIGNGFRKDFVDDLLSHYMPEAEWDCSSSEEGELRQDHWRLVWPTVAHIDAATPSSDEHQSDFLLFMSPEVLALMEPDILSQLTTYEPSSIMELLGAHDTPPHIKSFSRVYSAKPEDDTDCKDKQCACTELAWFLLTSACFSKGAQGWHSAEEMQCSNCGLKETIEIVEYRNFELGVLFHSSREKDTEYRAFNPRCGVHQSSSSHCFKEGNRVVLLPVPFDLVGGKPYYCMDSCSFLHRPYLTNTEELDRLGLRGVMPGRNARNGIPRSRAKRRRSTSDESCDDALNQASTPCPDSAKGGTHCEAPVLVGLDDICNAGNERRSAGNILVEDYLCDI